MTKNTGGLTKLILALAAAGALAFGVAAPAQAAVVQAIGTYPSALECHVGMQSKKAELAIRGYTTKITHACDGERMGGPGGTGWSYVIEYW